MRICWHGHSCFEIRNRVTVVTDPHDGRSIGISPPRATADLVLVSHDHFDHNKVRAVERKGTKVVREPIAFDYEEIEVQGFPSHHDEVEGKKRGANIIFRFCKQGVTFLHLGDIGEQLSEDMIERIGPVDIMFTPVGGVFTIDAKAAWKLMEKMEPKVVVPMHYRIRGLSLSLDTVDLFLEGVERVVRVGNAIDFQQEDLPTNTEVWLFTL